MDIVEFPNDRTVISTENNGFAGGERDENLIDEELLETEIPLDDRIPDAAHEDAENDRPVYDEEGYRHAPGGEYNTEFRYFVRNDADTGPATARESAPKIKKRRSRAGFRRIRMQQMPLIRQQQASSIQRRNPAQNTEKTRHGIRGASTFIPATA